MATQTNGSIATIPLTNRFSLPLTAQQEHYSLAWIRALAATAGYTADVPSTDYDSIDLTVSQRGRIGLNVAAYPSIGVQLKSTYKHKPNQNTLNYPLKKKNYDDLRINTEFSRILVVVHTPDDVEKWIVAEDEKMSLSHSAYWVSLRGFPEKKRDHITVKIPVIQKFTVHSLTEIMEKLANGVKV